MSQKNYNESHQGNYSRFKNAFKVIYGRSYCSKYNMRPDVLFIRDEITVFPLTHGIRVTGGTDDTLQFTMQKTEDYFGR
jgi:hypothetical protein